MGAEQVFSVVAATAAVIAAVIAGLDRQERRRQQYAAFFLRHVGWVDDAGDGLKGEYVELTQVGTVPALIIHAALFEAEVFLKDGYRVPSQMLPGERAKLIVRPKEENGGFLLLTSVDTSDGKVWITWFPLFEEGPLADERAAQTEAARVKRWNVVQRAQRRQYVNAHHVGPGGVTRRRIKKMSDVTTSEQARALVPPGLSLRVN